jgi:hypothetical protein
LRNAPISQWAGLDEISFAFDSKKVFTHERESRAERRNQHCPIELVEVIEILPYPIRCLQP